MSYDVVDGFAGPGGWSIACRNLGLTELGIEYDPIVCDTRDAAGFDTIRGSVADYGPGTLHSRGLIMSPPCQMFSAAGKGAARKLLPEIPTSGSRSSKYRPCCPCGRRWPTCCATATASIRAC